MISSREYPVSRKNASLQAMIGLSAWRGSLTTAATLLLAIRDSGDIGTPAFPNSQTVRPYRRPRGE
jgi:hypothetical protein